MIDEYNLYEYNLYYKQTNMIDEYNLYEYNLYYKHTNMMDECLWPDTPTTDHHVFSQLPLFSQIRI